MMKCRKPGKSLVITREDSLNPAAKNNSSFINQPCASRENADVHIKRVKKILPEKGHIGLMCITDKQFGMMEIFHGHKTVTANAPVQQLEMF